MLDKKRADFDDMYMTMLYLGRHEGFAIEHPHSANPAFGPIFRVPPVQAERNKVKMWLLIEHRRGHGDTATAESFGFQEEECLPDADALPVALCDHEDEESWTVLSAHAFDLDEGAHRLCHLKIERTALAARPGPRSSADCFAA